MDVPTVCAQCGGEAQPAYSCILCGAVICSRCYLPEKSICKKCSFRK